MGSRSLTRLIGASNGCRVGTPPATPTDTATAARPPRRCSTPAAPTWPPPCTVSHERLNSKHKSSSLTGTGRTGPPGQERPRWRSGGQRSDCATERRARRDRSACSSAPRLGPPASTLTVARAREQAPTTPTTSLPSWNGRRTLGPPLAETSLPRFARATSRRARCLCDRERRCSMLSPHPRRGVNPLSGDGHLPVPVDELVITWRLAIAGSRLDRMPTRRAS